jgi:hypothetical protein
MERHQVFDLLPMTVRVTDRVPSHLRDDHVRVRSGGVPAPVRYGPPIAVGVIAWATDRILLGDGHASRVGELAHRGLVAIHSGPEAGQPAGHRLGAESRVSPGPR